MAVLEGPDTASEPARQVAQVGAIMATGRLMNGDSLDFALSKVAAGRDDLQRKLASLGVTLDRKTVARALAELVRLGVLDWVGQLRPFDDNGQRKQGAFVYALRIRFRTLGDHLEDALHRARVRLARGPSPMSAAVRGTPRVAGALSAFIQRGQPGGRNRFGRWVVDRCIDAGLTEGQTMRAIRVGIDNVDQTRHRYTVDEAQRTIRSRYKRRGRRRPERAAGWTG